jgi:hypothetical protein
MLGVSKSSFCWHHKDDYLSSINLGRLGNPKVWNLIDSDQSEKVIEVFEK